MLRKTGKYLITLIVGISSVLSLFASEAQDENFYASVSKNPVEAGEIFKYTITLENSRAQINAPDFSQFQVVFGPATSSSYSIVNGKQTSKIELSYHLRALKPGNYKIGPASYNDGSHTQSSNSIDLEVVKGSSPVAGSNSSSAPAANENENLFVRLELSKRSAYPGEQIIISYVLYSRFSNIDLGEISFPSLNGFWSEEIEKQQATWDEQIQVINGLQYRRAVLRRQLLFPQRNGILTIEPMTLNCRVNRSFFNPGQSLQVTSNKASIEIKPLPRPQPETFAGATGDLNFSATMSRTTLPANEAATLTIRISGSGNLSLIGEPQVKFPRDFEVYDPEVKDNISVSAGGMRGSRTFEYLIIPRYPGNYSIDPIEFSYFDPAKEKFVTKRSEQFEFEITGSAIVQSGGSGSIVQNRVDVSGSDIRFIKPAAELEAKDSYFTGSGLFYLLFLSPAAALAVFLFAWRKQEERRIDVAGTRKRKAGQVAKKRLRAAETALKNQNETLFYTEVFRALYNFLSDKLGIAYADLNKSTISESLLQRQVDSAIIERLNQTISTCEMARFSPERGLSREEVYRQSADLITKLDSQL